MTSGGTVVTFEVDGSADDTIAVIERCRLARIALSLGGPETLLTHPATIAKRFTPAERAELGITDNLVRLSVGLEHVDDLIADLTQALRRPHSTPAATRHPQPGPRDRAVHRRPAARRTAQAGPEDPTPRGLWSRVTLRCTVAATGRQFGTSRGQRRMRGADLGDHEVRAARGTASS